MNFFSEESWINWVDQLSDQDYVVIDDFISEDLYREIRSHFLAKLEEDNFDKAGIGALGLNTVKKEIRGDFTYWLDHDKDAELTSFYQLKDELIYVMKRYCFLSIADSEFHYAFYPPGAHYEAHVDQFAERNNRIISFVLYLNEGWQKGDGGELKIFEKDGNERLVEPFSKRCVLFKSDCVLHQVMPTSKDRYSLTGWLLNNPVGIGFL